MAETSMRRFITEISTGLGVPLLLLIMLAMVMVPMPPLALDILFTFNIALSVAILLTVIYVGRPLDFGVFPTILLVVTLLRLALNIASTRVVLLNGHTGTSAAGKVIEAFGEFRGRRQLRGRLSDLWHLGHHQLRRGDEGCRAGIRGHRALYPRCDARKTDGDRRRPERRDYRFRLKRSAAARRSARKRTSTALWTVPASSSAAMLFAGILILFINIIGGLIIGTAQHGLALESAVENYTLLTIGDGLVAQIPSLLLSTAVAIVVTRVSRSQDMSKQVFLQLFGDHRTLTVTAAVLAILGLIPGMPNFAFMTLAVVCGFTAYRQARKTERPEEVEEEPPPPETAVPDLGWDDVDPVDMVGLEVGYRLIPLVDRQRDGALVSRIKGVRKKLTEELGFLVSAVHIRDNLDLAPNAYRISLAGVPIGEDEVHIDKEMAINPGQVFGELEGIPARDPAFDLEAFWIDPGQREEAQMNGYTVVDPSTVIATHLSQLLQNHADELLGHEETQHLIDRLATTAPKLVEELTPKTLALSVISRVLQNLLRERIPVRNIRKIAETLAEKGNTTQDPEQLSAAVRVALGRSIVQSVAGMRSELPVFTLEPGLERVLSESSQGGETQGLEPGLVERLHESLAEKSAKAGADR